MGRLCPNCRTELRARSKFCPNCGTTAVQVTEPIVAASPVEGEIVAERRASREAAREAPREAAREAPRVTARVQKAPIAPHTHAFIGLHIQAGFGLRFGALLFDLLIMMIVWMVATFMLSALSNKSIVSSNSMLAAVYVVAVILFVLNFVFLAGRSGQSLGKRIIGIRIVREDGRPLGYRDAAYRHLVGYFISAIGAMLGFIWIVWDRKQQGWHDKLAHTLVIMIP